MLNNIIEKYKTALNALDQCKDKTQYNATYQQVDTYYMQAINYIRDNVIANNKFEKIDASLKDQFNSLYYQACSQLDVKIQGFNCISKIMYIPVLTRGKPLSNIEEHHQLIEKIYNFVLHQYGVPVILKMCKTLVGHSLLNDSLGFNLKLNHAIATKKDKALLSNEHYFNEVIYEENDDEILDQMSLSFIACSVIVKHDHTDFLDFVQRDKLFADTISQLVVDELSVHDENILCYPPVFNYGIIPQAFKEILFENRFVITLDNYLQRENVNLEVDLTFKTHMTEIEVSASNRQKEDGLVYMFNHTNPYLAWQQALTFIVENLKERNFKHIHLNFFDNEMPLLN